MRRLVRSARFQILRVRHDWWYRWAHDPLCDRLGGGVLTIGRARVCRSCVVMYSGVAVGAAASVAFPPLGLASAAPACWLSAAGSAAGFSLPSKYSRLNRSHKDGLRFGTGLCGGWLIAFVLARRWAWSAALGAVAAVGYRVLTLARATSKASACDGCPELHGDVICSGFAQQAVSVRAYEQAASELAMRTYQPS